MRNLCGCDGQRNDRASLTRVRGLQREFYTKCTSRENATATQPDPGDFPESRARPRLSRSTWRFRSSPACARRPASRTSPRCSSITCRTGKCVELKSLKLYIWSYRNEGAFHEAVTNRILDDLVAATKPRFMRLTGAVLRARRHLHQRRRRAPQARLAASSAGRRRRLSGGVADRQPVSLAGAPRRGWCSRRPRHIIRRPAAPLCLWRRPTFSTENQR